MANLDWPGFGIRSITWDFDRPSQNNRSAYTGKRTAVVNPWHGIHKVHVDLSTLQGEANFRPVKAFFTKLKGQINCIRLPVTEGAQGSGTILGLEMVTNGTFTTDTGSWSAANNGVLSVVSNRLRVTVSLSTYGAAAQQIITTVVGQTYQLSANTFLGTAGANLRQVYLGTSSGGSQYGIFTDSDVNGFSFVATSTTTYITLLINSSTNGTFADYDNVSLKPVLTKPVLSANAAQGATSFAISSNPALTEGMSMTAILPSGNEQLLDITSVSGTTIGFEPALREAMVTGNSVEVTNPWCQVALADSAFRWSVGSWRRYSASFDAEEVF